MKTLFACLLLLTSASVCIGQAPDKNTWGDAFNSVGATLELREFARAEVGGQKVVSYSMIATGLPKDAEYSLWTRLVGGDPHAVAAAFIDKDGLVVNVLADPIHKIAEDPINLRVVAGKGEPKQFALVSNDGRYRVFGEAVPFPIENAAGPCHVSAIMQAANYSAVKIVV
jgi:hypothetical protein